MGLVVYKSLLTKSSYCKGGVVRWRIASFYLICRSTFSSEPGRNIPSYLFHPNLFPQHYIQLSTASYQLIESDSRHAREVIIPLIGEERRPRREKSGTTFSRPPTSDPVRNQYEQAINASLKPDLTVNPELEEGEHSTPFPLSIEYSPGVGLTSLYLMNYVLLLPR